MGLKPYTQLGGRALSAASGRTAPQEWLGALGLAKDAISGNASNFRLGPDGEVMYDSRDPNAAASAMGSFVKTDPTNGGDVDMLKHELQHVKQSDALGPLFGPAVIKEQFANLIGGYGSGPLERNAIEHATPQSEMFREGSSGYVKKRDSNSHAFLRALLNQGLGGK